MPKGQLVERVTDPDQIVATNAVEISDPEQVAKEIMAGILAAETAEQVLSQAGTTSARDILGEVIELRGATFHKSRYEQGAPVFALMDATRSDGQPVKVTCSGRNVLAQVYRLIELDALPVKVSIMEAGESAQGFRPLWLVPAP